MTKFDLEERTQKFGEDVIKFAKGITLTPVTTPLVTQLVRSATSIGANYEEADGAESKKDFTHKLEFARKRRKKLVIGCV